MKVTATRSDAFRPVTLTIVLETQAEVNTLRAITSENVGVPASVSRYYGPFTNFGAVYAMLGALREPLQGFVR
jgi:hypothetical protein